MQPSEIDKQQNQPPSTAQNPNTFSADVKYILISFVIVLSLSVGGIILFQLLNKKTTSTASINQTSQNVSGSSKQKLNKKTTSLPITPTGVTQNSQVIDNSSPEAVNLGNDDVALSDLQKDLQGL